MHERTCRILVFSAAALLLVSTFQPLRAQAQTPITLGTVVAGSIDVPGEVDSYSFTLADDALLHFDSFTNSSTLRWSLSGPAGSEVSNRAFSSSDSTNQSDPTLDLFAGSYLLTVDASASNTGAYSFVLQDLASAPLFTPGTPVSDSLDPANESHLHRFDVVAGEAYYFDVQTGISTATWRLVDPFDNLLFSTTFTTDIDTLVLSATGSYTLVIEGRVTSVGTAPYTFDVVPVPVAPPTPIALDTVVNGSISVPGETDVLSFSLGSDRRVHFDSFTNDGTLRWSLIGPAGSEVSNRTFSASDSSDQSDPTLELVAGSYLLSVDATSDNTGMYSFRLHDVASATLVTPGTPVSDTLDPANESHLYRFDVLAGEAYYFDLQTGTSIATWRLVDPFDNVLFSAGFTSDVDTTVLSQPGSYTLVIEGRVTAVAMAPYTFDVVPVPVAPATPIALDTVVNGSISVAGETDVLSFTLGSDRRVHFDSFTNDGTLRWSLIGPAGSEVSNRTFSASDSSDQSDPTLELVAGSYLLSVDATSDNTGAYSFRLHDVALATLVTPGTPVSDTLDPANESHLYRFDVLAGEAYYFDLQTGTSIATWRLVDPFDNVLFSAGFTTDVDTTVLSQPGSYTLVIEGRVTAVAMAPYTFDVVPVLMPPATPIALDTTVAGSISVAGETDVLSFTLGSDRRVHFDSFTNASTLRWSLSGPAGSEVSDRTFSTSDSFDQSDPTLELVAGSYLLSVDATSDNTGAYSFRLHDVASATLVTPGTPVSDTLDPANESHLYRFDVLAGEAYYFDVQTGISTATWRLVDPFDNVLFSAGFTTDVDTIVLSQPGSYTLVIEGRVTAVGTAAYTFDVVPVLMPPATPIALDTTVAGSISVAGETDVLSFTLGSDRRVHFDSFTNASTLRWSLSGPAGSEVSNRTFSASDSSDQSDPTLELVAGSYLLSVDATSDNTGAYSFRLHDVALATLVTPGTPVSDTLDPANESHLYRFDVLAGDEYDFDVQTGISTATWRLVDPFDTVLFSSTFNTDQNGVTLTQAGSYTLAIEGRVTAVGTAAYMFDVQFVGNTPPPPFSGTPLTLDAVVSDQISVSGEEDPYIFTLASESRLYFDSLTNDSSLRWSLVGPAGAEVTNRSFTASDSISIANPVLRLVAGDYLLTVSGSGAATGAYSFELADFASATPVTPGTPFGGTLDPANETDFYEFAVSAGDRFFFDSVSFTGATNARWRVIDPFDTVVFETSRGSDVDATTLSQAGTYTLLVEGRVSDTVTGAYTYDVQPLPVLPSTPLPPGSSASGSIGVAGETDTYTFTLASESRLYFDSLTNDSSLRWSLVGPAGAEVTNRSFTASDSINVANPVLRLVAGDYTLTVDGAGDHTGAYDFDLVDFASAAPVTPGTPFGGTLDPGNETDFYEFAVSAGDRFFFDSVSFTGATNARWRVIDPFDTVIFETSRGSDVDATTLSQAGTYTLLIEGRVLDTVVGSYTYNVQPLPPLPSTPLPPGSSASGSIGVAGETDAYTFTLVSESRLYFDSFTNDSSLRWSLVGPAGAEVTNRSFAASDSISIANPVLRLVAGDYTLTVDGAGDHTASYDFDLVDFASAAPVTPGTPFGGTLDPGNETDFYEFAVSAGDRFFFDSVSFTGATNARWRVIDPFDTVIFETSRGSDVDATTLSQAGTYTLLIEGRVLDTVVGSYTYNVQPLPPLPSTPLPPGSSASGSIGVAGETDAYTFTLVSESRLYFDSFTNDSSLRWSLVGPAGAEVTNRSFAASDSISIANPVLRLVAGDYTLTVDGAGDHTASYDFDLVDFASAAPVTPGTPFGSTLDPGNETDFYEFAVSAGDRFFFDSVSFTGATNARWRVIDPFDTVIFETSRGSDVDATTLSQAGTYTLLVEGRVLDTVVGSYTYNVQPLPPLPSTPLPPGSSASGSIGVAGESDTYTFTLLDESRLYFDSLTNDSSLRWSLVGPAGAEVTNRSFAASDSISIANPVLRLVAGDYTLTVDATGDHTASYDFDLLDLEDDAKRALVAHPVSSTLVPANETDLYWFRTIAGNTASFDSISWVGAPSARWRLISPYDEVLFEAGRGTDVNDVFLANAGMYTLLIEGRISDTQDGTYTFEILGVPGLFTVPVPWVARAGLVAAFLGLVFWRVRRSARTSA